VLLPADSLLRCLFASAATRTAFGLGVLTYPSMTSERKVLVHYSLSIQEGINPPISSQSNQPIPAENTLSFDAGNKTSFDYKKVLAAIQQAKVVTGQDTLTPWRDAVGDKEKGKDAKQTKSGKAKTNDDQEEVDEEEVEDEEA